MKEILQGRYGVDAQGVVYSLRNTAGNKRKLPLPMKTKLFNGYLTCNIYVDDSLKVTKRSCFVHRLVAQAYLSNPDGKTQINHKDGNKTHNKLENLEWATPSENMQHAVSTGLKAPCLSMLGKFNERHNRSKAIHQLSPEGVLIKEFPSLQEAQRQGFSQGNISSVIAGTRKSHKGFKWAFAY